MCVVSMIADHYIDKYQERRLLPEPITLQWQQWVAPQVTRAEFEELQREVKEMRTLLEKAKVYDLKHNQPGCEVEKKMAVLRKLAEMVGVDLGGMLTP